jgi:hypothetical protein
MGACRVACLAAANPREAVSTRRSIHRDRAVLSRFDLDFSYSGSVGRLRLVLDLTIYLQGA